MRGPVDSEIKLTIQRDGTANPFDVTLKRAVIKIQSVKSQLEGDDIGYIRISSFNEQTDSGVQHAIKSLQAKDAGDKLVGVVLDLRNNPGGLLDQAIAVSNDFLTQGEIVSTRGRHPEDAQRYDAQAARRHLQGRADGGADQRRLGLGVGDRRRRACRIITARCCSARAPSARARCRPSSSCPATARCG